MRTSDRIFGLVLLLVALGYAFSATQIQTSFLTDPVGPKMFPLVVGLLGAVAGAVMLARPDPEPEWPGARTFGWLGFAVAVLLAYALALKPLGFLVPTAVASAILAWQITPKPAQAAMVGVGLSVGIFVVFRYMLGLGLAAGPRWLIG